MANSNIEPTIPVFDRIDVQSELLRSFLGKAGIAPDAALIIYIKDSKPEVNILDEGEA